MIRTFSAIVRSLFRQRSTLKWVFMGICIVAVGIWSLSNAAQLRTHFVSERISTKVPSTAFPSINNTPAQPMGASGKIWIRWSIGPETGTSPEQVLIENEVVANFNASQDKIFLTDEVVPDIDALLVEFANGAGPDIVGPIGGMSSNTFYGQWLDISPYIQADNYDASKFEEAVLNMYHSKDQGTVGLPFAVYPSALYYNIDLFEETGLNPPPAKYGEKYVKPDGTEVEWNWDTVKWVAQNLTIDVNGSNALDPDFDKNNIVQYGFTFQWENKPSYWGTFWQSELEDTFLVPGGAKGSYEARIPEAWKKAWKWYYDGIWGDQPYVPNGGIETSAAFNTGNAFASGKIATTEMPAWYLCCVGDLEKAGGHFDFGSMPTYHGKVNGRIDADTFLIWKGTKHPREAWKVLKYLLDVGIEKLVVGTPDKPPAYGALPGIRSLRRAWLIAAKANHPSVKNWDVLLEGLNYPDVPNAEAYMPNMLEAWDRTATFSDLLKNARNLDMDKESEVLKNDLTLIFNK